MRAAVPAPTAALREGELTRLWEGQRFPPEALATRRGEALRVVYPGRRGRGPGPDFRDAIIASADGRLLQGDVELHVRASDFRSHGHHLDPAYDRIVLHVAFWDDEGEDTALLGGGRAAVVALAPWVAQRAADLAEWLAAPARWREPCRSAVARLGREEVAATLDRLGDRRFAQKAAAFAQRLAADDGEELLYGALVEAMGYGGERPACRALAAAAPWSWLRRALLAAPPQEREEVGEALLLGAAGLLPSSAAGPYAGELSRRWQEMAAEVPLPPGLWRPSATRPANHPQRRLAGLARLLARHAEAGLAVGLREAVVAAALGGPPLAGALTVAAGGFWATHADLSGRPLRQALAGGESPGRQGRPPPGSPVATRGGGSGDRRRAPALIGTGRALEVAANAVLPFFAAWGQRCGDRGLEGATLALYRRLPRPGAYGVVAFLEANLGDGAQIATARQQQALLYLLKNYCTRGGCGRCPLS